MSKTSISSIVCFDIIDFAKKTAAEQKSVLAQFKKLLDMAIVDIPDQDLHIAETSHGAIVTCKAALESALEDALFIALTVRDEALGRNADGEEPIYLLIGINLGSVKMLESQNVNEPPTIEGEGLVEAQRIMSFANPNQILVSKAYHEMASKLTLEIAQMFEKYDMHAYEHDIYAVRRLSEQAAEPEVAAANTTTTAAVDASAASEQSASHWQVYFLPLLLALIMMFVLIKWFNPAQEAPVGSVGEIIELPELPQQDEVIIDTTEEDAAIKEVVVGSESTVETQAKKTQQKPLAAKKTTSHAKKKAPAKQVASPAEEVQTDTQTEQLARDDDYQSVVVPVVEGEDTTTEEEKSTWKKFTESIKQGAEGECTQAQRVLNQCK